jgi:hypothetical protein
MMCEASVAAVSSPTFLFQFNIAIDLVIEADLTDCEHHLRVDSLDPLKAAVGKGSADRFFNLLLR